MTIVRAGNISLGCPETIKLMTYLAYFAFLALSTALNNPGCGIQRTFGRLVGKSGQAAADRSRDGSVRASFLTNNGRSERPEQAFEVLCSLSLKPRLVSLISLFSHCQQHRTTPPRSDGVRGRSICLESICSRLATLSHIDKERRERRSVGLCNFRLDLQGLREKRNKRRKGTCEKSEISERSQ